MSTEAVDIYVYDSSPMANPVAGVTLKITSQDGKIFYTQVTTDSSGHAGLLLWLVTTCCHRGYRVQRPSTWRHRGASCSNMVYIDCTEHQRDSDHSDSVNVPARSTLIHNAVAISRGVWGRPMLESGGATRGYPVESGGTV